MKNLLLTGEPGVGKSTLLRKLLAGRKICGFITVKKEREPDGSFPVFIGPAAGGPQRLAARVNTGGGERFSDVFDNFGTELLRDLPNDAIAVMDELGFLEDSAERFKESVLSVLENGPHVIGVIKPRSTRFLDSVRAVPDTLIVHVDENSRNELFSELTNLLKEWDY
ncbi:MAG: hypothetical protein GXY20_05345 [Clostridiales bacterium]|nr:hypothetical protein [Clostridiales bacterium]